MIYTWENKSHLEFLCIIARKVVFVIERYKIPLIFPENFTKLETGMKPCLGGYTLFLDRSGGKNPLCKIMFPFEPKGSASYR